MDSIQAQVLESLRAMAAACTDAPLSVGALPPDNGFAMAVTAGRSGAATLAGGETVTLDVALNAKHESQREVFDALCAIHEALSGAAALPSGAGWQLVSVRTGSAPAYVDREGAYWLYGSALTAVYTVSDR